MEQTIKEPAEVFKKPLIRVEKATLAHVNNISDITREAFKKYVIAAKIPGSIAALTETIEDIQRDITEKNVFIAYADDIPAGTIRITLNSDNTAYISRYGVLCKYQSMGIGKALMEAASKHFLENNIKYAYLHTAAEYQELIGFYLVHGFKIIETAYDKGYPRALLQKEI